MTSPVSQAPLVAIEGPTQFDAAVDKEVAAIKMKVRFVCAHLRTVAV